MGGVFLLITLWPFVLHGEPVRIWAGIVAAVFGISGVLFPTFLEPVHRIWMKIGEKLGWVNSRIILGIMFFGVFTPGAFIMSLLGKRPLQLGFEPKLETYRVIKHARDSKHVLKPF